MPAERIEIISTSRIRMMWSAVFLAFLSAASHAAPIVLTDSDKAKWSAQINSENAILQVEPVALALENPWGFAQLPNGSFLVTERPGRLRLVVGDELGDPIDGLPELYDAGQGGLLDVALDPAFADNQLIYLSFSEPNGRTAGTAVLRARFNQDGLSGSLENTKVIFRQNIKSGGGRHFGSRLTFSPDGHLFVTIGERGDRERAQDMGDHAGSVVRIMPDGSVPADNPFIGTKGALTELWSVGHRNPQGAAIHPVTKDYWVVEHGARGGDELNRPQGGKNYGWPVISYGRHYSGFKIGVGNTADGLEQPVHFWDPSIAPSGLTFYASEKIPSWNGNAFVGALKDQLIARLAVDVSAETPQVTHEEQWDMSRWGRIREVEADAEGNIWFLTDEFEGGLFKITPTAR
ncbi:MAG: PQQ-dependent sugar dehydrogenase [Hyphomicrobiales bacterium]